MRKFHPVPGCSVSSVERPVSLETIRLLGASFLQTFEPASEDFEHDEEKIRAFARMLRDTGKTAPTYHLSFYGGPHDPSVLDEKIRIQAVSNLRGHFDTAKSFGSKILVMHPSTEPLFPENRERNRNALFRSVDELLPTIRAYGFHLALELLPRTCLGNSFEEIIRLVDEINDPLVGVCADVNHLMNGFAKVPDGIRMLGKRLFSVHLSDFDGIDEKHWMPGVKEGVLDWKGIIQALDEIGYEGNFNYEIRQYPETPEDRIAGLEKNYREFMTPVFESIP